MTEKSTAEFEWRDWPGECECGGPMKYYTDSENDEAIAQHADPVICIGCGSVGHIDVYDEDDVTAEMHKPDYTPIMECMEIGMNPRQMFAEIDRLKAENSALLTAAKSARESIRYLKEECRPDIPGTMVRGLTKQIWVMDELDDAIALTEHLNGESEKEND